MQFGTSSEKYEALVDLTCLTMGFQRHFILFVGFARISQYFIDSEDSVHKSSQGIRKLQLLLPEKIS
jgi:hypothetical protein